MSESIVPLEKARVSHPQNLTQIFQRYGLFIFLVLLIIIATLVSPQFMTVTNMQDVLNQAAPLGMVTIGQTFVILTGGLDLSVSSLMATVAVIAVSVGGASNAMSPVVVLLALAVGIILGLVNGWLVTERKVSPFLATLATMIVLQGIRFAYTKGAPSGNLAPVFRTLGTENLLGMPINLIALAILTAIFAVVLYRSAYGRKLYMVGGNARAAYLMGIHSNRVTMLAYIICSVMASLAGLFLVGYVGSVDNWVGRGYELDSIAAALMGGASFKGGQGGLFSSLAGVLTLVILFNLVLLLGLPVQGQLIVKGVVIILATAFYLSRGK
ncbi:MAG: ABC transporter permease [Anaerolineae bacterium]